MNLAADRLVDWRTARAVGERVAGIGPPITGSQRRELRDDFEDLVRRAEELVTTFTGLTPGQYPSRAWVMTRGEWIESNLRGFQRVLEPFARRVLDEQRREALASFRRQALAVQVGGLLGYLARRVLGQYDLFVPPDDEGLLYFAGPNIVGVERKYDFAPRDFRFWLSLHEVAHRLQFGGVPWLRGHISGLVDSYLSSVELDPKRLLESLKRSVGEVRSGRVDWRGFGWVFLLMTPDQRDVFRRMQAVMTLLEGHGNFVMDVVGNGRIRGGATFKRKLRERRNRQGLERAFQKAIGFDTKVRQYDMGERFVAAVVHQVGMDGFNKVWEQETNLPSLEEVGRPDIWVARVGAA